MLVVRHLCPVVDGSAYVKEITVLLNEGALTLVEENNEADERIKLEDGNIRAHEVQLFCQDEDFRQGVYEKIKTILEQKGKLTGTTAPRAAKKQKKGTSIHAGMSPSHQIGPCQLVRRRPSSLAVQAQIASSWLATG